MFLHFNVSLTALLISCNINCRVWFNSLCWLESASLETSEAISEGSGC